MAVGYNPRAITDGLVLALDAGNPKNYNAGISTNWMDKVGGNNGTLVGGTYHTDGPFVGAGSVYFDGSGDYLQVTANSDLSLTGDFTVEYWTYLTGSSGNMRQISTGNYYTLGKNGNWYFGINTTVGTDNVIFYSYDGQSNDEFVAAAYTQASLNSWYHLAATRVGSTVRLFVNGELVASGTISKSLVDGADGGLQIGRLTTYGDHNGYISNLRIIKGTALYTSNFTPPTKPLTAVTNTTLLTCQGNTIADASSSAHTITANGDISLTKEPFAGAGAVDFGGSADGLYTPNITLGSNDWTLEFWIYLTSTGTARGLYSYFLNTTTARGISCYIDSSNQIVLRHRINDGTYPTATGSTALSAHTWYHVAAVRVNDDYYIYINGVQDASYTSAPAGHTYYADGVPHYIGYNRNATSDFDGLLSNVRLVNGTALYTSNFTPPAEPLTAVTNTELLTCQGQGIKDASSNAHAITVNGDAKATIVSSAFEFDGTNDYVSITNISNGTDDFTYEAWVYPIESGKDNPAVIYDNSIIHISGIYNTSGGTNAIFGASTRPGSGNSVLYAPDITLNTWHHIAWVKSGSSLKIYVDGVN